MFDIFSLDMEVSFNLIDTMENISFVNLSPSGQIGPDKAVKYQQAELNIFILSKPQLNHNSTQPQSNITLFGLKMKMTLHSPHAPPHLHKLNVSNISAVTDPIVMKL